MKKILAISIILVPIIFSGSLAFADLDLPDTDLPEGEIATILSDFLEWAVGIFLILGILAFVVAGIMYSTALGNDDQIEKAKSIMTWAIIGLVVGLSAYIILDTINTLISSDSGWF